MPSGEIGIYRTYRNANTLISGDSSRSACTSFNATKYNDNNIVFSIGSRLTTWSGGENMNFALAIRNGTHVDVFGMQGKYDNRFINVGPATLYDGAFHQICVTYNSLNSKLCVYRDSQAPTCLIRSNGPYNTAISDVRIGWWPDLTWQFVGTGGGQIKSLALFNMEISQDCVIQTNTN
ncbi:unnamed protein product [Didymodactylos carnosus]|uniref:Lectin n=1 Tax=Didymodactylos carnosus TaxID=1234261 RepID=A0A8S2E2W5_9BILA|nr:unnamed protein product [Didymodactylos carnosus]CAF3836964.1 unnamed protein product [Didymodactylos carnosus]